MYLEHGPLKLWLEADDIGLTAISFVSEALKEPLLTEAMKLHLIQGKEELLAYFNGELETFSVPLHFTCGTDFQQKVWYSLRDIPYGHSLTYQEVAHYINSPRAQQAVGQANKKNPLPIIIPCHRVIGKNGKLTGYQGSEEKGLEIKRFLLELEKS